ncbi:MAG: peptidoglycan-associated lipoprotein Pal [Magnetospirillum sp.]|nr:peptidoglycan-associated lipoprotein Pal [Magnetospirillum sp.]
MRKVLPVSMAAALLLAACADSAQNTGTVSGAGGTMGRHPAVSGGAAPGGAYAGGRAVPLAAAQNQLVGIGDRVYFDTDSYTVNPQGRATLDKQILWLKQNPSLKLLIEGHADERGTREYNLALGDRRATSVRNYLIDNGIAPTRLRTISYGKEKPVAVGSDEAAWAQNRRAVSVAEQ